MRTNRSLFEIPQRVSLSAQAAAAIRHAIERGAWEEYLPSERRLCEMFQVSRPTIRTALHILAKDGWLNIRQGRRNRLPAVRERPAAPPARLVGLVIAEPVAHLTPAVYQSISDLRTHLAEHGFDSEILVCHPGSFRVQRRKLAAFVKENRVFCCVLLSVGEELQRWFTEQSVPALVLGSCHPTVRLPSLDLDHHSICRHAAGLLLGKGHRRIALVVPNSGLAGDLASERGFQEGMGQRTGTNEACAMLVRHNGTAQNIITKLDVLFDSAQPPTALLVAMSWHLLVVMIYLLKRGLSVPGDVSVIARDQDPFFEFAVPAISHYRFAGEGFVHRLSRLMLKLVSYGYIPAEPNLIFPKYFEGGTVKRVGHPVTAR